MASAPTFGFSGLGAATNRLTTSPSMAGLETMLMAQNQLILQLMTMLVQLMGAQGGSSPVGGLDSAGGSALSSPSGGGSTSSSGGFSSGGNAAGGQAADPSQFQGGTEIGRRLAAAALRESTDGDSPGGYCARDVGEALRAVGLGVARGDAWTKAEVLARDPRFKEMRVAPDQIDKLPPGAIIVWDKNSKLPYGHISIALGDGREASDKLRKQMHLSSSYRVFMPVG